MKHLHEILEQRPTQEQLSVLQGYPTQAIEKAFQKLKRRGAKRSFNYFLAVVKDVSPDNSVTVRREEKQSYVRDLPEEDPMEAVTRTCENLCVTSNLKGYVLTPDFKRDVALKDPWFDKLTTQQKAQVLTRYPFYAKIVGLGKQQQYWQQLHDGMMKD